MGAVQFPLIHLETFRSTMLLRDLHSSELWTDLLQRGILEYVDPWELLEYRVAMQPKDLMGLSEAELAQ